MDTIKTISAGGVVLNADGKVLVVSQRGNSQRGDSWSLPKGHIESDEQALEAAKREIHEESGIDQAGLELVRDLGSYERYRIGKDGGEDRSELKTLRMFLFKTKDILLKPIDPDNPEARWVDREVVAALLTHPKDKEFFSRILKSL